MRIIDSSGTRSFNMNYLDIEVTGKEIFGKNMDVTVLLGRYSTDERALGVFNELHRGYAAGDKLFYMPED